MMTMFNILWQNILPTQRTIECLKRINWTEMVPFIWFLLFIQISCGGQSTRVFFALPLLIIPFCFINRNASALAIRRRFGYRKKNPKQFHCIANIEIFLEFFCHVDDHERHESHFHCLLFFAQIVLTSFKENIDIWSSIVRLKTRIITYKHYVWILNISKIPSAIFCYSLNTIQFGECQRKHKKADEKENCIKSRATF